MTIAQARNSDTDYSAGKEKLTARSIHDARTINIGLDKFSLQLEKKRVLGIGKKVPTKTILEPVTSQFEAGVLNVIMGPSGSGKTSLLNAMALRTHDNLTTKYRQAGNMTFNGAEPSDSVVRSVVSYVCQDDDGLLPSLTVRETLRFSAGLRLPSFMTKEEKTRKAEEVLMKMGLKDCADNLIGGELVKGKCLLILDPQYAHHLRYQRWRKAPCIYCCSNSYRPSSPSARRANIWLRCLHCLLHHVSPQGFGRRGPHFDHDHPSVQERPLSLLWQCSPPSSRRIPGLLWPSSIYAVTFLCPRI